KKFFAMPLVKQHMQTRNCKKTGKNFFPLLQFERHISSCLEMNFICLHANDLRACSVEGFLKINLKILHQQLGPRTRLQN
ncbi:MAG: hypothetical protein AAGD96_34155, partial [Chloroflexota bacterium]